MLRWTFWVLATLGLVLIPTVASAGTIKLAWDPVSDADLAGYRVYYGTSPGVYTNSYVVTQPQNSADLTNLQDCRIYYLAVKAVDSNGNESLGFSNEIIGMPAPSATSVVVNLNPLPVTGSASSVKQGTLTIPITITGTNFDTQATPDFGPDIQVNSHATASCNQLTANITVTETARVNTPPGPQRLLKITNQNGPVGSKSGALTVVFNEQRADIDGSGKVGGRDLLYWQNSFGTVSGNSNYNPDADLNGDGVVDGSDLSLLAVWHGHIFF
ncbi:MAG TPA: fibronectin type III domain-containing protein [Candidatus Polarisedimenticolia bacterium]|nr:fibronectin type III domain-containing protein [Candidatus Polarisedimenticolia bacterium]